MTRDAGEGSGGNLLLKNVLFTVLVPGTVAVYVPIRIGASRAVVSGPALVFAVLLLGIGASTCVRCIWDFASAGRGTPAPMDPPKRLVVQGLYRTTRNPMYLGVLLTILGWAVLFGSGELLVYAALVATCFHLAVVLYEEPRLRRKFGAEYEEYRSLVPRWAPRPTGRLAEFFALACGISWFLWSPLWLPAFGVHGLPVLPLHHVLGALGPIAAAFVMSAAESGKAGPRDLLRRMVLWRGRMRWVAVALFGPFAILGVAVAVAAAFGDERSSFAGLGRSRELPELPMLAFLAYNLVTFGWGEEAGWRGFALPRLQARRPALSATLLLTAGWALWHVPLFLYRPGYTSMDAAGVAGWLVSLATGAILLTWLYNESGGSILVVALFHASVDAVFTSQAASPLVTSVAGMLVTAWGIAVLVAGGPARLSRRGTGRFDILREIESLDPERDNQRIVHLSFGWEFPWDSIRALEVALYRTYAMPSVSALLDRTGEFYRAAQRRYDDTAILIAEMCKHGYEGGRGRQALERMNWAHGHFKIANDDFLYVLSTFVFEPIRWIDAYGWRRLSRNERLGFYCFWREVGKRMGIRDIPESYDAFLAWSTAREETHLRFEETNRNVAVATRDLFASWFPRFLAPAVRASVYAVLDDAMLRAFAFPKPPAAMRALVRGGLKLRGRFVRWLPPRSSSSFFVDVPNRTYPYGWEIGSLGPPRLVGKERDEGLR